MSSVLGQSSRRIDASLKVQGAAVYGMDYAEPFMLFAKLRRSTISSGRIVRLDTERASKMPGVRAIITGADCASRSGWFIKDQTLMAVDEIRYFGEPIAAVAADTEDQAAAAAAAIELEVESFDPVASVEAAQQSGARSVHPDWSAYELGTGGVESATGRGDNIAWRSTLTRGDVDAAFADAHAIIEDDYTTPRHHQSPIEPHCAVARFEDGRYVIHTPTQYPFLVRDRVAELLALRPGSVRVVATWIGGGFGGKIDVMLEPFCAILARKTGRPVKITNTRTEELQTAGPRESSRIRLQTAVSAEGIILGQRALCELDCGAFAGETVVTVTAPALLFGGTYRIPNAHYEGVAVYTNTTPTAAFRGTCGPYSIWAVEQHMDHIARELDIDRRELRLRNLLGEGDELINGQRVPDDGLRQALDALELIVPWEPTTRDDDGPLRGVGLAVTTWVTNPGPGNAMLKVNEDGTIGLICGAVEIGSGAVSTALCQLTASELGVSVDDVVVLPADTDASGYDGGAQGGRTTVGTGNAILMAADSVREQILAIAAELLETLPGDLELKEGQVNVVGSPSNSVGLADIAQAATWTTGPIAAVGRFVGGPIKHDSGCTAGSLDTTFFGLSYHAHIAEVEVDRDTGRVVVTRYVVAQDVGRIINPQSIRGQIQGGVAQGIGYALFEELRVVDGVTVDSTLESYRLPTALDVPDVEFTLLEIPCQDGPHGAKGVGEAPIVPAAAAVANAVADAIGSAIDVLPLTPWRVLERIREGSGE